MAVLLANRRLGVRRRTAGGADGHGDVLGASWGAVQGPHPGRASEGADTAVMGGTGGRTWVLAVDPGLWPVYQGDIVSDPDAGQEWLVVTADLLTNNADPAIDYIRIEGHLHTGAGTAP